VLITAKGHQTYKDEVSFAETQRLVVKLDKLGQRPTKRPAKDPKDGKSNHIDTKSPYEK
jgi:hypothetical protein